MKRGKSDLLLVGHRGAKASEPENTLRSFRAAIRLGANAVEFDTRLTRDARLVVIHDKTLDRTTNGSGLVSDHTFAGLRKLDAGLGEKIPSAREALDLIVRKNGKVALMEVKDAASCEKVARLARMYKPFVIVHAWSADHIKRVKAVDKEITAALIVNHKVKNLQGFFRLLKAVDCDWVFIEKSFLDEDFLNMAHKYGIKVEVWVCNTLKDIRRFVKMGVDGVASDRPELFGKLFSN